MAFGCARVEIRLLSGISSGQKTEHLSHMLPNRQAGGPGTRESKEADAPQCAPFGWCFAPSCWPCAWRPCVLRLVPGSSAFFCFTAHCFVLFPSVARAAPGLIRGVRVGRRHTGLRPCADSRSGLYLGLPWGRAQAKKKKKRGPHGRGERKGPRDARHQRGLRYPWSRGTGTPLGRERHWRAQVTAVDRELAVAGADGASGSRL